MATGSSPRACPGSPRCSVATAFITSLQALAFAPHLAVEIARDPGHAPGDRGGRLARQRARQDPPRAPDRRDDAGPGSCRSPRTTARSMRRRCGWSCSARRTTGPATTRWSTGCGRTPWRPSTGSTAGATATATGSWSTSGAPTAACATRAGRIRATAIRWLDGSMAETPIALAEVQGYVYDAKRRIAGLARHRGDDELGRAARPRGRGPASAASPRPSACPVERSRWRSTGRSGRSIRSARTPVTPCGAGSSGRRTPRRRQRAIGSSAMVSGWGLRTFATDQAGYNPIGYHTGTVWPHDTAIAAAGLRRYGLDEQADALCQRAPRRRPALPGVPAPRALLRVRPGGHRLPDRLPRGLLAAGLGGRARR